MTEPPPFSSNRPRFSPVSVFIFSFFKFVRKGIVSI
ncbi:hypothetical protein AYI69_g6229, partial [Smittium culicis]